MKGNVLRFFFRDVFLFPFWSLNDYFLVSWQRNYLEEPKKAIHVYRRKCCGKLIIYFEKQFLFILIVWTLSRDTWNFFEKNGTILKAVAYVSERKNFRKNVFGQLICHQFWTLTKKNFEFTGKNWAGMSKLSFVCTEKLLQSNVFERKC